MALWKPFRGNRSALDAQSLHDGYAYFCTDDGSIHFDYTDADGNLQRKQINAKDAETLTGTSLDDIKNLISTKADVSALPQIVTATSDDGVAYVATVSNITSLAVGASFIMIPGKTSASTTPTINVNGLGAKYIRRRLSNLPSSLQAGYAANWLPLNKPFRLIYDGTAWIVEGQDRPSALDLYGDVAGAQKATNDSEGQQISTTYIKDLSVSAREITYTKGDGTTSTASLSALIQALLPKATTVSLPVASWQGESSPYYQDITSSYVTETSKVDIQPTIDQLVKWQNDGLAFNTLSANGSFRVYVSDFKPTEDMSVQVTIQEVLEV